MWSLNYVIISNPDTNTDSQNTRPTLVKYQKLKLKRNQVAERAEDRNVLLLDTSASYKNYLVVEYWLRMSISLSTVRQKLDKVWHPEKNWSIQDLDWDNFLSLVRVSNSARGAVTGCQLSPRVTLYHLRATLAHSGAGTICNVGVRPIRGSVMFRPCFKNS